jgi:hypothetical protein
MDRIIAKRSQLLKTALIRKAAEDPKNARPYAQAMAEISKATPYDYGYRWREEDFSRDPSTGRFRTKVNVTQKKPIGDKQASFLGLPTSNDARIAGKNLSSEELAAFQDQYRQLAGFLSTYTQSTANPGDDEILVRVADRSGNQYVKVMGGGTHPSQVQWDPKSERVVGIEARPTALRAGGAYFGLASSLGAEPGRRQSDIAGSINAFDDSFNGFSTNWGQSIDPKNSSARTYGRIKSGSELASSMAPPGSKIQMAARFGEFVGSHGAEAEKVIGPTARKTAYRYRGTEKTPDKKLMTEYNRTVTNAKLRAQVGTRDLAPTQMAAQRVQAERRKASMAEINEGRKTVLDYFQGSRETPFDGDSRIPKKGLYNLQLASGNTPPSEGVLIDRTGNIVTQAIGYGDDHYLPFNLKNLKGLKGGEYVRTRSVGGLTSEDIYTGLTSGARRVTVVSRSGTFTVTFEDDFRGGRRHNDKARRMSRRYEQILDAVQSEQVDRATINPEIRAAIVQEVRNSSSFLALDRAAMNKIVQQRIEDFKQNPDLSEQDEALARVIAENRTKGRPSRDAQMYLDEATNLIAAEKEYKFRLNGLGYAAALESLREQFPYYITVNSQPRKDPTNVETERDKGYVEPGNNRPTEAAAGLFGAKHRAAYKTGTKFSASEADYQRGRLTPLEPEPTKPNEGATAGDAKPKGVQAASEVQRAIQVRTHSNDAIKLHKLLKGPNGIDPDGPGGSLIKMGETEFAAHVVTPLGSREFDEVVKMAEKKIEAFPTEIKDAIRAYRRSSGDVVSTQFRPGQTLKWTEKPQIFVGLPAYQKGADPELVRDEVRRINERTKSLKHGGNLSELTEKQMREDVDSMFDVYSLVKEHGDLLDVKDPVQRAANVQELHQAFFPNTNHQTFELMLSNPDALVRVLEDYQRMRTLLANNADAVAASPNKNFKVPTSSVDNLLASVSRKMAIKQRIQELEEIKGDQTRGPDAIHSINAGNALLTEIEENGGDDDDVINSWLDDAKSLVEPGFDKLNAEERRLFGVRPESFEVRGGQWVKKRPQ